MSFIAGIFLWSLSLLSIPILIALWNRRRRLRLPFGGYFLLRKISETSRRRIQILQFLKLLNRLVLVTSMVLIFAEPQRPKEVFKEASEGFALFLDTGRVMQGVVEGQSLSKLQIEAAKRLLLQMPSSAKGMVFGFGSKCRGLKTEDGQTTAGAEDWLEVLDSEQIPYSIEPTTNAGLSDCFARASALYEGKAYLKFLISPLPATLDPSALQMDSLVVEKLPEPQVRFVEKAQLREEGNLSQVKISGFDGRQVSLLRPPERPVDYGEITGDLELPLTQESWLLVERPQANDPWEGMSIFPLNYAPQKEVVLWAAKESDGYLSLLTALRAHPRLKVVRQIGGRATGDAIILYGSYSGELNDLKRVWLFQSSEGASPFAIRDQKQLSSLDSSADLRKSFLIKTEAGSILIRRYVLFDTDEFTTLESFEDGAPSLLQFEGTEGKIWVTPFDLEDLTTDLSLEKSFIPYLYEKLDRWLEAEGSLNELSESKALWLSAGSTKPHPDIVSDQLWPGIYQVGARWMSVEAGAFPVQFTDVQMKKEESEISTELISLRQFFIQLLAVSLIIELLLCFLSARFGWLFTILLFLPFFQTHAEPVRERVPVGVLEGVNPDRMDALRQLVNDSVFLSNLEFASPEMVNPDKLWSYALVFSAGDRVPSFSDSQIAKLREYLEKGGLLIFDDPLATLNTGFRAQANELIQKIFPGRSLESVPSEDVIFRTFYLLTEVSGRRLASPQLEGVKLDSRWVILFSSNDLLGAILRGKGGDYLLSVSPYGIMQRTLSQRLLMNFLFYSLTVDYKDDAIHLPHILKRRNR